MRSYRTLAYPSCLFAGGACGQLGDELKRLGDIRSVLVVYDTNLYNTGLVQPILIDLERHGFSLVTYSEVQPDTPDYTVTKGAKLAKEKEIDAIVGIGGGSTLDTAKAISIFMGADHELLNYFPHNSLPAKYPCPERSKKMILIPTTSGTGSELSPAIVLTDTQNNVKLWLKSPNAFPDLAIVDPNLTLGLPAYITASTGMDALAHAIETMTCTMRSPRADMICGQVVEYVWRSLPVAVKQPDNIEARSEMAVAASIALTGDGTRHIGHCIAHAAGAKFHIPHGHACAVVLPEAIRWVAKDTEPELRNIARRMRIDEHAGQIGETIASAVEEMNVRIGLKPIRDFGMSEDEFIAGVLPIVMMDQQIQCVDTVPTEIEMERLLVNIYRNGMTL